MKEIAHLKQLRVLNLLKTKVSHAGLGHLARLRRLHTLRLPEDRVTDRAVATLRRIGLLYALSDASSYEGTRAPRSRDNRPGIMDVEGAPAATGPTVSVSSTFHKPPCRTRG